ncbi:uncharacterized protein LOC110347584 [Heterocephalus glaber]|uniref:Uncharacterized protein LOC110347584 n=1 Tax=Heterocephalus glaber TaxID=10181 RepID=A0AAX6SJM0_HETGA|nr:uncharacterized protein LOC110347584 [Heterocephalus glaber]
MFNFAASSSYSPYAASYNFWYLALTQQQAPALLGGPQQPPAGPFPFWWLWNRAPPVNSLLENSFPPLLTAKTPGQQTLPALENSNAPEKRGKRSRKTKKAVAAQPIISEQQKDDIEKSTEQSTVPTPAREGEENPTAQAKDELGEGLPVMQSGPQTAQAKGEPAEGLPVMQSGTPTSQVINEPAEGLPVMQSGPPTAQAKGELRESLPVIKSRPLRAQVKGKEGVGALL